MKRIVLVGVLALVVAVAIVLAPTVEAAKPEKGEAPKAGPPPKPVVLRFVNIPAESFIDTLKQLGRNEQVAEALRQLPIALNEPANAVVVLAPPEAAEFLAAIAKGLDQPNEFRRKMQEWERQEMEFRMRVEEAKRRLGGPPSAPPPPPGPGMRPGEMGPPSGPMGMQRPMWGRQGGCGPMPGMGMGESGPPPAMGPGGMRCPMCGRECPWGQSPGARREGGERPQGPPPSERGRPERPRSPSPEREHHPAAGSAAPVPAVPAVGQGPARFQMVQDAGPPPGGGMPGEVRNLSLMFSEEERAKMGDMFRRMQQLRLLDDPSVRSELKMTPQQEEKIAALKEKGTALANKIREDMQARFQEMARPDLTDEERQAMRQDLMKVVGETVRGAMGDFEGMMTEATDLMTPEQREQLGGISRERTTAEIATAGLAVLLTPQAKEQLGLSSDQVDQIRVMLKGLEADYREMRDKMFGPGKELTAEDMKSEKYPDFQRQHQDLIAKTRDRILTLFNTEQREKVEKFLASRGGRGQGRGPGFGRWRPGGLGGQPPAAPAPGTPAPEAPTPGAPAPEAKPPAGPVLYEAPPRFWLAAEAGGEAAPSLPRGPRGEDGGVPKRVEIARGIQLLRLLDEPETRSQLGLTPDQEKKIYTLQEKAKGLHERIRDEAREKIKGAIRPGMSEPDRQALRQEMDKAQEEAMRETAPQMEAIVKEAADTLTEEQRTKLKEIGLRGERTMRATGGLGLLTTKKVQEELGLTDEQATKIKAIVKDLEEQAGKLHDEVLGPGKDPGLAEAKSDKFEGFKRQHGEMVAKARDKIMALLTPEQREKIEKKMADRPGPGGPPHPRDHRPPSVETPTKGYGQPV